MMLLVTHAIPNDADCYTVVCLTWLLHAYALQVSAAVVISIASQALGPLQVPCKKKETSKCTHLKYVLYNNYCYESYAYVVPCLALLHSPLVSLRCPSLICLWCCTCLT
jgi:hypothetical protein